MSETRVFSVPDLGEGLTDATLTEWFVDEGDTVQLNQPLCSLSTAKAEVEIPSPFAGQVGRRHGQVGDTIDVGTPLVELEVGSVTPPATAPDLLATTSDPMTPPAVLVGYGTSEGPAPRLRRQASPAAPCPEIHSPNGRPHGAVPVRPPERAAFGALAKPPVRALAKRLGVDIQALAPGSGPDGIVTRNDVEAAGRSLNGDRPPTAPPLDIPTVPAPATRASEPSQDGVHVLAVRGVRALIAERMTTSRQSIPEAWCGRWVDATDLVARVEGLRTACEDPLAAALTPFAVMLRFVVAALRHHPLLNATFDAEPAEIRTFDAIHLGVAVSDDRGLIVPVVRNAQRLTTAGIALEIRRLVGAVRGGKATPAELSGSTFTVSNFGALGLDDGNPIINAPEAAILGIGAIRPRPVVVDGDIVVRSTAKLTCAFDHRICDGSEAGRFLADLARLIEGPDTALLDL
jgi:2-oxoisovalerate dehydrogenase E2 component (dihydrolipoyl transacylase)